MKVKRREVQCKIVQLLWTQALDTLTWPSVSVYSAEEANVDISFLFTFYRLAPTNGWEGQNWSLGSNTYCVLSVRLSTYPSSIQYCCQILYLQKHENCRLLLRVRKDFSASSFLTFCEMDRKTLGWRYKNPAEAMEQKCEDFQSLVDWLQTFNLNYKVGQIDIVQSQINLTGNKAGK